jgi:iduronate 2-sulfatase
MIRPFFTLALLALAPCLFSKPNVLFINVDDLRTHGGVFTKALAKTPHMDRLAARATTFERAYVQYTVCNPSRASYMTGLRCEQTGVLDNRLLLREAMPEVQTLPQLFKEAGWHAAGYGKLYHLTGTRGTPRRALAMDLPRSWHTADAFEPTEKGREMIESRNMTGGAVQWCWWGMSAGEADDLQDGQVASAVVAEIQAQVQAGKPWFIGCGFSKPHDPFIAPQSYFDLYPLESLPLWKDASDLTPVGKLAGIGKHFEQFTDRERREFLRAYLAGVSFMDAQLGRVLDVLDELKLWEQTIVVFLGDHGYHHGERGWWNKNTLFERTTRAPLMIAAPGMSGGQRSESLVEFIDILPTLTDLAGLTAPSGLPGVSLRPVLQNPKAQVKDAAFSLITRGTGNHGRRVRTASHSCTVWSDGAVELYDMVSDPEEQRNVAMDQPDLLKAMTQKLATLPPVPQK